jgi:hypothetical protein
LDGYRTVRLIQNELQGWRNRLPLPILALTALRVTSGSMAAPTHDAAALPCCFRGHARQRIHGLWPGLSPGTGHGLSEESKTAVSGGCYHNWWLCCFPGAAAPGGPPTPPLLLGGLLCVPWPPREGGPAALEEWPSSEDSLLFLF